MIEQPVTEFHCRTPNFQNPIQCLEIQAGGVEEADTCRDRNGTDLQGDVGSVMEVMSL